MNDLGCIFKEKVSDAEIFMNIRSYCCEQQEDAYRRIQYKMLSRYTIKTGKIKSISSRFLN